MNRYTQVAVPPTSEDRDQTVHGDRSQLVEKHGGRCIAQVTEYERLEASSENPTFKVIMEWPSRLAAEAFYADPAYQPHKVARLAGIQNQMFLIPSL